MKKIPWIDQKILLLKCNYYSRETLSTKNICRELISQKLLQPYSCQSKREICHKTQQIGACTPLSCFVLSMRIAHTTKKLMTWVYFVDFVKCHSLKLLELEERSATISVDENPEIVHEKYNKCPKSKGDLVH
jgi:hypothetical protein